MSNADVEVVGSKRSSEDYDEYGEIGSYKKQKHENISMRLLMLGKCCGGIIGKGGENIKRIRSEFSVQINVPDTRSKERVLTIVGDRGNCIGALRDILPTCIEAPYQAPRTKENCPLEINLLVQTDQVGSLIGKSGAKVKEIREESNGKIKIYQECLPNSNERVVAIGGEEREVLAALDIILDALRDKPKKDISRYYDPKNAGMGMGMGMGQQVNRSGGNLMGMGGDLLNPLGALGGMGLGGGLLGQLSGAAAGILGAANLWGGQQDGRGALDPMNGILGSGGADRRQSGGYSNQGGQQSGGYSNQGGQSGGYSNQGGMNRGSNLNETGGGIPSIASLFGNDVRGGGNRGDVPGGNRDILGGNRGDILSGNRGDVLGGNRGDALGGNSNDALAGISTDVLSGILRERILREVGGAGDRRGDGILDAGNQGRATGGGGTDGRIPGLMDERIPSNFNSVVQGGYGDDMNAMQQMNDRSSGGRSIPGISGGRVEDVAAPSIASMWKQDGGGIDRGMRSQGGDGILGSGGNTMNLDGGLSSRDYGSTGRDRLMEQDIRERERELQMFENSQRNNSGGQSRNDFSHSQPERGLDNVAGRSIASLWGQSDGRDGNLGSGNVPGNFSTGQMDSSNTGRTDYSDEYGRRAYQDSNMNNPQREGDKTNDLSQKGFSVAGLLGRIANTISSRDNRDDDAGYDDHLDFGQMTTVTKVTVPNEMCGAIIGKGGSRIKDIRQSSGARVDFSECPKGSKENREITISGTQNQIQLAEKLMTQYVRNRNI